MPNKDYGPILSRYLDPSLTGFDTVVYQSGKPILDSEFVLDQEIQGLAKAEALRAAMPSGFVSGDANTRDFVFEAEANCLYLDHAPLVHVHGALLTLGGTGVADPARNRIALEAPPVTVGSMAADFVFLEVWRALVAPSPSTANKPTAGKVYFRGNVLSDASLWLDDDLVDSNPAINVESTKRVQLQYRLRAARLDTHANRLGYTSPAVTAQGGGAAATPFAFAPVEGDPGLWRAGDGLAANGLGAVDGYVYSIPVAIIYRRNSAGYHFLTNGNGAPLLASGVSAHPDGLFADVVAAQDVLDLRHHVSPTGLDAQELLERNLHLLLDQSLRAWVTNSLDTGSYVGGQNVIGNRYLRADDLVPFGYVTPDPTSGISLARASDGFCTTFTDRPHHERHIKVFSNWQLNQPLTFDILGLVDDLPQGTVIADVAGVYYDDDVFGQGHVALEDYKVTGLGTQSASVMVQSLYFESSSGGIYVPPVTGSGEITRDVWVEFEIFYPAGHGLSAHVTEEVAGYGALLHVPSAYNAAFGTSYANDDMVDRLDVGQYVQAQYAVGSAHREVVLTHTTASPVVLQVASADATTIYLPEALYEGAQGATQGVVSVTVGATSYPVASTTGGRVVRLATPLSAGGVRATVTYFPRRPLPRVPSAVTLYYKTAALGAVPFAYLQNNLPHNEVRLRPLYIAPFVYTGTASSGSSAQGFPFEAWSQQIPVHIAANYRGEEDLAWPGPVMISDFDATTGFLRLPALVPMAQSGDIVLRDPVQVTTENAERVDHYTSVDLTGYKPSAFAQSLSVSVAHKCFVPMLARLEQDTAYARKGTVVMVIVSNFIALGSENNVAFSAVGNTTCAAIYPIKGQPLMHG